MAGRRHPSGFTLVETAISLALVSILVLAMRTGTNSTSDGAITLKNSGDMYAVVYAPAAEVIVYNSATLWGAITSRTCEAKTDTRIYYDASLANQVDSLLPPILKLASWREY